MGANPRLRACWAVVGPPLCVAAALVIPTAARAPLVPAPPQVAAERAERELPPIGLGWGKVRSWQRVEDGWTITWQPSHGAWLLRAWVPDYPGPTVWRLAVAPWLPGVRLSRRAAGLLLGDESGTPLSLERVGRRDWVVNRQRLAGALPAGGPLPAPSDLPGPPWGALLAGCLLGGAVTRMVFPGVVAVGWRRTMLWACLGLALAAPLLTPVFTRSFEAGVRPWVAELTAVGSASLVIGALALGAIRFPAKSGRPSVVAIAAALGVGLLAGRLQPGVWISETAGVEVRLPVWIGAALLGGWLAGLAGEGLRELLEPLPRWRPWLLGVLAVGVVPLAGPWLAAVAALLLAAGVERGHGTWVGTATIWGAIAGGAASSCGWWGAQRDALTMTVAGGLVLALLAVADLRRSTGRVTAGA